MGQKYEAEYKGYTHLIEIGLSAVCSLRAGPPVHTGACRAIITCRAVIVPGRGHT